MIIKKFQAPTEAEAVLMAKEEMGSSAVVVNVKTVKHRGIAKFLKKDYVEITAALEEKIYVTGELPQNEINEHINRNNDIVYGERKADVIEEKLNSLQSLLETKMKEDIDGLREEEKEERRQKTEEENEKEQFIRLIYNQMIKNEVDEKYANQIIAEVQPSIKKDTNVDTILGAIYQKIILKLGQPRTITIEPGERKAVFFIGPTGVGKTTTIAKIAAHFKLNQNVKVALITADTYRIAAVEQLKTYANIIDVPLKVIYTMEEFNQAVKDYSQYDLILIDTAGRSHKNKDRMDDLNEFMEGFSQYSISVYLVLSATTKYKDLKKIVDLYEDISACNLIFTKLDETDAIGNILNIKLDTGMALSYVSYGQNVPDDIEIMNPQVIAKQVLGGGDGYGSGR